MALLIGGLGFLGARRLGIDQELRAMLPDDASSVVRLDAAAERLGNQSDLYVSIRSPSRAANLAFGAKIAAALARRPDIRYVLFHRDAAFFTAKRPVEKFQTEVTLPAWQIEPDDETNLSGNPDDYYYADESGNLVEPGPAATPGAAPEPVEPPPAANEEFLDQATGRSKVAG